MFIRKVDLAYYTGCRIGEVMGLTWKDINISILEDLKSSSINIGLIK